MEQYIKKSALVAEIEKLIDKGRYPEEYDCAYRDGNNGALYALKDKLNTLEVKEVSEHNDVDMNSIFEEIGVDPDSHIASLFKNAFYKAVDKYLEKRELKYDKRRRNSIFFL